MISLDRPRQSLEHRELLGGEFWRAVPKYRDVDEATFLDHVWQGRNSVKTPEELLETIKVTRRPRSSKTRATDLCMRRWPFASRRTCSR